jgi:hypothetical protein
MDSQITSAARALAHGDLLGALKRVSLREDPPALALRGIAMAQLGEFARARDLLKRASRAFGQRESVARARCVVAEAEIALASRDLQFSEKALVSAKEILEEHGDRVNAIHAECVRVRRLLLLGKLSEAEKALLHLQLADAPPMLWAAFELLKAEVALRNLKTKAAENALISAEDAARRAGIASLLNEVQTAKRALEEPAAVSLARGKECSLRLADVEAILKSDAFIVDAVRNVVRDARGKVPLARRPVLFTLARVLAEAWPDDASRENLIAKAFGATRSNDSHRARLRVEIGRLRRALRELAELQATPDGFAMTLRRAREIVVLVRPLEDQHAGVLALLADGESWSSSAIALALGASQRTVQRALYSLEEREKVRAFGHARARRWVAPPMTGFTTTLLLPGPLPTD